MTIKEILDRLAHARARAGLSCSQADNLFKLPRGYISLIESADIPLEMETFLKMCVVYEIDEVWALTGLNPNFDPTPVAEAAAKAGMDNGELGNLLEFLASQKQEPTNAKDIA